MADNKGKDKSSEQPTDPKGKPRDGSERPRGGKDDSQESTEKHHHGSTEGELKPFAIHSPTAEMPAFNP